MLDRFTSLTRETKIFIGAMIVVTAFVADWWIL